MLDEREKHATMLTEMRALSDERRRSVVGMRDTYERLVGDVLAAAQQAGTLRADREPRSLTLALLNLLNWTIFWYDPDGDLDPEGIAELLGSTFLDGTARVDGPPRRSSRRR